MTSELMNTQGNEIQATGLQEGLVERFLAFIDVAPKSAQTYAWALKQMWNYLEEHGCASAPSRDDIMAWREDLKASGKKPTTVQNYITAAKLFFRWTAQEGIYPNIADHLKGAKLTTDHKKDYLTSRQVKRILAGIDTSTLIGKRDYAIIALAVTDGLRTIEIERADIEDLRTLGDDTVLYIQGKGKAEKGDYVKVSAPVEAALHEYLKARGKAETSAPLFASASHNNGGGRMDVKTISRLIKAAFRNAGYDSDRLTAHSLRHTAVTLSLIAGKDITEVQQFARHANIATTMIYNHALDKAKNGCTAAVTDAIF